MMSIGVGGMTGGGGFTATQWAELEHQALIFKYIMAGVPVPPDLLHPIRSAGLESIHSPYYRHSALGYYSYYGKKLDPEPWRCRRTDGKKWRCAKEAYPDSKYCERHMNRGRNRSRKPVEISSSSPLSKTPLSSSSHSSVSSPSLTPHSPSLMMTSALNPRKFETFSQLNPALGRPTCSPTYLNRYMNFSEPSGNPMTYGSSYSSFPSYLDPVHEDQLGQIVKISSLPKEHQKPSFLGFDSVKSENPLRPFFDEWPVKNRGAESWADLENERNNNNNNNNNFSTTRLSISIPMGSSASSPNDD